MKHQTKVMATLTLEQCADTRLLSSLCAAGMKGVRINSAHVTPIQLETMVHTLRSQAPDVTILMDTKGPELRTAANINGSDLQLTKDSVVQISDSVRFCTPDTICIPIPEVTQSLTQGIELIIDDGEIHLQMLSPTQAVVTKSGVLGERKSVNLVGCEMPQLPAVSKRDRINLHAAAKLGIDIVAHSFVRSADDIQAVRSELTDPSIKLLAKVETRLAVENLESITQSADGLLVARGDLGTQISPYAIPSVQRRCAKLCRDNSKSLIIATQILQSMMHSPEPTRAELSDIALGTWQQADFMLLCGETAQGSYPVECVRTVASTILNSQSYE